MNLGFLNKTLVSRVLYGSLLLAIIIFTVFGDAGLYRLHSLYNTKKQLARQIRETETRIAQADKEKLLLINPEYLESVLRKELGYIKAGEVVYQVTPEDRTGE